MSSTPRRHGGHATLAALLASALFAPASAQAQDDQDHVSTAMAALLAAVVAVFVLIAAAVVYLRHCSGHAVRMSRPGDDGGRAAVVPSGLDAFLSWSWGQRRRRRSRGLDAEAIEAFPTMRYADAKALRVGAKGGVALECAVCLTEFEDEERLRLLLPRCCHAFHPDCIGEWLASHVTCPVCRCNLQPSNKETTSSDNEEPTSFPSIPEASSISSETAAAWRFAGPLPVGVVIDVVIEEEEEERRQEALELQRIGTQRRSMRSRPGLRPVTTTPQQLARWHSTGHSLAERLNRDLERFTLRLPEHVRTEMVAAAAEHSLQMRRGRRAGEGGGGRSAPLIGRLGRWQSIIGRTFFSASRITVSSGGGEVSSSSSTRVRGKRVVAVDDVADDVPAKGTGSESGAKAGAASCELEAAADEEMAVKQKVRT